MHRELDKFLQRESVAGDPNNIGKMEESKTSEQIRPQLERARPFGEVEAIWVGVGPAGVNAEDPINHVRGPQLKGEDLRSVANPWRSDPTMDYEDVERRFDEQGLQYRMTYDSHIVESSFYDVVRATVSGKVSLEYKAADKALETFLSMALQALEKRSPKDLDATLEIRNSLTVVKRNEKIMHLFRFREMKNLDSLWSFVFPFDSAKYLYHLDCRVYVVMVSEVT